MANKKSKPRNTEKSSEEQAVAESSGDGYELVIEQVIPEPSASAAAVELFASGDLGNVQKFLFAEPISRLSQDIERLSERLSATDKKIQLSLQEMSANQREQSSQLNSALIALERHVEELDQGLQTRILEVEHAAENANDVLQASLQDISNQWDRTLDQTREELFSKLVEASQQLQQQKLDRRAMAQLLGGLADTIDTDAEDLNISWLPTESVNG